MAHVHRLAAEGASASLSLARALFGPAKVAGEPRVVLPEDLLDRWPRRVGLEPEGRTMSVITWAPPEYDSLKSRTMSQVRSRMESHLVVVAPAGDWRARLSWHGQHGCTCSSYVRATAVTGPLPHEQLGAEIPADELHDATLDQVVLDFLTRAAQDDWSARRWWDQVLGLP